MQPEPAHLGGESRSPEQQFSQLRPLSHHLSTCGMGLPSEFQFVRHSLKDAKFINVCGGNFSNLSFFFSFFSSFLSSFCFLGPHPWHMEVPGLGVKWELYLRAYTTATATAMTDLSHVCDLHHSLPQCRILNTVEQVQGSNPQPHRD